VSSTLTYVNERQLPTNLIEAIRYFADPDVANEFVAMMRWGQSSPDECPRGCGGTEFSYLTTRRLWKCKTCKAQSSVKVGTIFEDSPIPLDKWLCSIWLIANSKNGISSHELGRSIGLTQKSSWFVLHRIRLAMRTGTFEKFDGEVEVDETFVGGNKRKMNKATKARAPKGTGFAGRTIVAGVLERGGTVRAKVVRDTKATTLAPYVRANAKPGATVYTDALTSYARLSDDYDHATVDHATHYVNGRVHTNGMENFWSLLKRGLNGTYVRVAPEHLTRYVDERVFTFNQRHLTDLGRFSAVLGTVAGRRLTWAELTSKG
jgi:transposase-like protein